MREKDRPGDAFRALNARLIISCGTVGAIVGGIIGAHQLEPGADTIWHFLLFVAGGALGGSVFGLIWWFIP